jgi:hypothetical protein
VAGKIDDAVSGCRKRAARANLFDPVAADEEAGIAELAPRAIHRHQYVGVTHQQALLQQRFPSGFDV